GRAQHPSMDHPIRGEDRDEHGEYGRPETFPVQRFHNPSLGLIIESIYEYRSTGSMPAGEGFFPCRLARVEVKPHRRDEVHVVERILGEVELSADLHERETIEMESPRRDRPRHILPNRRIDADTRSRSDVHRAEGRREDLH